MAGRIGRPTKRHAERALKTLQIQEIVNLSESKLIQVLKGETKLPEKTVVNVALELYKRRVPTRVENENSGNKLTVIKIVKNHLPSKGSQEIEKIDAVDAEVDRVVQSLEDNSDE